MKNTSSSSIHEPILLPKQHDLIQDIDRGSPCEKS